MHPVPDQAPWYAQSFYRLVTAALGLLLVGLGVFALLWIDDSAVRRWLAGPVLLLLGGNMLWSAHQARASWVSRIGPLP